ncbi:hypothetical protein CHELA20_11150 [Hyphomicrobiales bacterium]|nr:hypothetical protein CHELA20_11150 [Hyphomicrobiales bacterium]
MKNWSDDASGSPALRAPPVGARLCFSAKTYLAPRPATILVSPTPAHPANDGAKHPGHEYATQRA